MLSKNSSTAQVSWREAARPSRQRHVAHTESDGYNTIPTALKLLITTTDCRFLEELLHCNTRALGMLLPDELSRLRTRRYWRAGKLELAGAFGHGMPARRHDAREAIRARFCYAAHRGNNGDPPAAITMNTASGRESLKETGHQSVQARHLDARHGRWNSLMI